MFSPPHTRHASASAVLPAKPQYWKENLPAGHGKYNSHSFQSYCSDSLGQVIIMLDQLCIPLI